MVLLAGCFALTCASIARQCGARAGRRAAVFFALYPLHMMMAVNATKDVLFSGCFALTVALLCELTEKPTARLTAAAALCGALAAMLRNNMAYAAIVWLVLWLLAMRKKGRAAAIAMAGRGYAVSIGNGGAVPAVWLAGSNGGATSAFGITAQGGKGAGAMGWKDSGTPGAGTGAGGTGGRDTHIAGAQGENGQDLFGLGRYGAGGGGGGGGWATAGGSGGSDGGGAGGKGGAPGTDGADGTAGAANTGGGAGGPGGGYVDEDSRYNSKGGQAAAGGSGIVILRGTQDDLIPVVFNGTQLSELYFNGVKVTSLIYNGARLFIREVKRCFAHQAVKLC